MMKDWRHIDDWLNRRNVSVEEKIKNIDVTKLYSNSNRARVKRVIGLYEATINSDTKHHQTELIVWILNLYPFLGWDWDEETDQLLECITKMILLYCTNDGSIAKYCTLINELHDLLCDLHSVWIDLQHLTNSIMCIDLFPKTTGHLSKENNVNTFLEISGSEYCLGYLNATLNILLKLSAIVHRSSLVSTAFLTHNISWFEVLISIVKLGNSSTKTKAIEYMSNLFEINGSFRTLGIYTVVKRNCLLLLQDQAHNVYWPTYRTLRFDECLAKLVTCFDDLFSDWESAVRITERNIENTHSSQLGVQLVRILGNMLLKLEGSQISEVKLQSLITTILRRGYLTVELMKILFSHCKLRRIASEPPLKKPKLKRGNNDHNSLGVRKDRLFERVFNSIENHLNTIIRDNVVSKHRDLITTLDATIQCFWCRDRDSMTNGGEADHVFDLHNCTMICTIMDYAYGKLSHDATLFIDLIKVFSANCILRNDDDILRAEQISSSRIYEIIFKLCSQIIDSDSKRNPILHQASFEALCCMYAMNPKSEHSEQFVRKFGTAMNSRYIPYMHCILDGCSEFERSTRETGVVKEIGQFLLTNITNMRTGDQQTKALVAREICLMAPSCLRLQTSNLVTKVIEKYFQILETESCDMAVLDFPKLFHALDQDRYQLYRANLKTMLTNLVNNRNSLLHSQFIEDLLIHSKVGSFMDIVFECENGTERFIDMLHTDLRTKSDTTTRKYVIDVLGRIGVAVCSYYNTHSTLLKRIIIALKDGIHFKDDEIFVKVTDYIYQVEKTSGLQIADVLPFGDELFHSWLIDILSADHKSTEDIIQNVNDVVQVLYNIHDAAQWFLRNFKSELILKLLDLQNETALVCYAKILNEDDMLAGKFQFIITHVILSGKTASWQQYQNLIQKICKKQNIRSMLAGLQIAVITEEVLVSLELETHEDEGAAIKVLRDCYSLLETLIQKDLRHDLFITMIDKFFRPLISYYSESNVGIPMFLLKSIKYFKCMLQSMGDVCNSHVPQVVCLLKMVKQCLEHEHDFREWLSAWKMFIRLLSDSKLKANLPQIITHLIPYAKELDISVLHYIYIEKSQSMLDYLPSLPAIPELQEIRDMIPNPYASSSQYSVLEQQMDSALSGLQNDCDYIKLVCATKLKAIVENNYDSIYRWIDNATISDKNQASKSLQRAQLVFDIYYTLLQLCASARDSEDKIAYAECLGVFGAIDPSRFSFDKTISDPLDYVSESDLVVALINQFLYREYRSEDYNKQKCAMYCIHHLLKILKINGSQGKNNGTIWWDSLDENKKDDLLVIQSLSLDDYKPEHQLIHEFKVFTTDTPFDDWLICFCEYFTASLPDNYAKIFNCLRPVFNSFRAMTEFLVPYVVKMVILSEDKERYPILLKEFQTILEFAAANLEVLPNETMRSVPKQLQVVLSVLELLRRWVSQFYSGASQSTLSQEGHDYTLIEKFLQSLPDELIAKASFHSRSYEKSLLYYDKHLRNVFQNDRSLLPQQTSDRAKVIAEQSQDNPLLFLQLVHRHLEIDVDILSGISALRKPSFDDTFLAEKIIDHEAYGEWSQALNCYEQLLQQEPDNISYQLNTLKCNRNLGHLQTMLRSIDGTLTRLQSKNQELRTYAVESTWRLSEWDHVREYLVGANQEDFEVCLAKAMIAYYDNNSRLFKQALNAAKITSISSLSAACLDSYESAYNHIVRFQMLAELEQSFNATLQTEESISEYYSLHLLQQWRSRLKLMVASLDVREPIISLQRVLFRMHGMEKEEGNSWLLSSKLARKRNNLIQAQSSLLQTSRLAQLLPNITLTYAKLLHASGNTQQALAIIQNKESLESIQQLSQVLTEEQITPSNRLIAKMKLLSGIWSEMLGKNPVQLFKEVIEIEQTWEQGYFYCAKHLDSELLTSLKTSDNMNCSYELYVTDIISNYGSCLKYGVKHIFHALPRLIRLVCNVGDLDDATDLINKVVNIFNDLINTIENRVWVVNLSQIVSRIKHKNVKTSQAIVKLWVKLLDAYPKQSVWSSIPAMKDNRGLFQYARLSNSSKVTIANTVKLAEELEKFCREKNIKKLHTLFTNSEKSSRIMIPLQSSLTPDFACYCPTDTPADELETIDVVGIGPTCKVMQSKVKPIRFSFIGTDQKQYPFLVKSGDDLKKDNRFMEFSRMLNVLFMKNPETRRRRLYIRTFSAIPITQKFGLIEWVENTTTYIQSLIDGDENKKDSIFSQQVRQQRAHLLKNAKAAVNVEAIDSKPYVYNTLMRETPAVLHRWYYMNFPDPAKWFQSRLNFVRTCAVMSMVGWTMGLGDRHTENILLDSCTGDLIHIDLNMLFEAGKKLVVKERVPFRLTPNMTDAMGITGYEGTFRITCEVTLESLRENKHSLMNTLDPFTYDANAQSHSQNSLQLIGRKLDGLEIKDGPSESSKLCNVQAQVDQLISSATDPIHLSHMYAYWFPWF